MVQADLSRLCRRLGYEFQNRALLKRALTHCSAGVDNNERLEYLGDSVLNFVIASALFERFPEATEGELSRLRASLVKGEMLGKIAAQLQIGDFLFLGPGEMKSGGFRRSSILADALEAVIAAILLDSNLQEANRFILRLFEPYLSDTQVLQNNIKDFKTRLQEYLQGKKLPLPCYELLKIEGEDHEQVFFIECRVAGLDKVTTGQGQTRRKAEQIAAGLFLDLLNG